MYRYLQEFSYYSMNVSQKLLLFRTPKRQKKFKHKEKATITANCSHIFKNLYRYFRVLSDVGSMLGGSREELGSILQTSGGSRK